MGSVNAVLSFANVDDNINYLTLANNKNNVPQKYKSEV